MALGGRPCVNVLASRTTGRAGVVRSAPECAPARRERQCSRELRWRLRSGFGRPVQWNRVQYAVGFSLHVRIAFTGELRKPWSIQHRDLAACVPNGAKLLKLTCCSGYAFA